MKQRFKSTGSYARWFAGAGKAPLGRVSICDARTGECSSYDMRPSELRGLVVAALRALAFTKTGKVSGQWESTWQATVDGAVGQVMTLVNAVFPKNGT